MKAKFPSVAVPHSICVFAIVLAVAMHAFAQIPAPLPPAVVEKQPVAESGRATLDLSGPGWKLWRDKDATWKTDPLFLRHEASGLFKPGTDSGIFEPDQPGSLKLEQLPVNPPTGGWGILKQQVGAAVAVPGTVEEYFWGKDRSPYDEQGVCFGVSWWWREFALPVTLLKAGHRVILRCASTRQRSEIYIDRKLCAYDVVGNTPYEFDVTDFIQPGKTQRIAFRITNPGGNFSWGDNSVIPWGAVKITSSHGFGGISGPVSLDIVPPVAMADLWVRNTPAMREIIPTIALANTSGKKVRRDLEILIRDCASGAVVASAKKEFALDPGRCEVVLPLTVPDAKLWSPETPNLYVCSARLLEHGIASDLLEKPFGFRWFDVRDIGKDARFVLNGKRTLLLSAISWGHWPQGGLFATPELASKQVATAKKLGLNCLNNHRTIGDPKTLEEADRKGLMYYEEPGGCEGMQAEAFSFAQNREKFLRMVKRDRSHPSVIHYNMANEAGPMRNEGVRRVLHDVHALDPTRSVTWSSGGTMGRVGYDEAKSWMKPLDMTEYHVGWWDQHNAGVSDAYLDTLYNNPHDYHGWGGTRKGGVNRAEITFWGEEGPLGTPPRLQLLKDLCSKPGHRMGWDGADWLQRYDLVDAWLKESGMGRWFTVDSLTQAMGDKQYYYHGRMIENARIDDVTDGYVISGWENDKQNTMCGLVDLWRNTKTDNIDLIRAYTRPLYVAVKLREKVAHVGETAIADFWLVNEENIHGEAELKMEVLLPSKKVVALSTKKVQVSGGERYGELLEEAVKVPVDAAPGYYTLRATLSQEGKQVASGSDQLLAVDWKGAKLPAHGAILESNRRLTKFFKEQKGVELPTYDEKLGPLDFVLVGTNVEPQSEKLVGADGELTLPDGSGPGLMAEYFKDKKRKELVLKRTEQSVDCDWQKAWPDARLTPESFSASWTGKLRVPEAGYYEFLVNRDQGESQVEIGKNLILTNSGGAEGEAVWLEAGTHPFKVLYYPRKEARNKFQLSWRPQRQASVRLLDSLLKRAREDGTSVVFLNPVLVGGHLKYNDELVRQLTQKGILARYDSILIAGPVWLGGSYIAGAGPLFEGLPERTAFSWEYQLLANGPYCVGGQKIKRTDPTVPNHQNIGLRIAGAETLVGAWTDFNADPNLKTPGTAVGVIPCGKGRVVLSTLEILPYLESDRGAAHVVRKLLCNMAGLKGEVRVAKPSETTKGVQTQSKKDAESWIKDSGMKQRLP
jgi:hypothetical protein